MLLARTCRRLSLFVVVVLVSMMTTSSLYAQSAEEEVRAAIDRMFDGMRAGDSTMVGSVFHKDMVMARVAPTREGTTTLQNGNPQGFLNMVGSPHDKVWDEKIWDVKIHIDGDLASAWMNFAFYLGEDFSHCGVNSMQFHRTEEGWKIIHLADTSRREGCDVPDNIK